MNDDDKVFAQRALAGGKVTREQVEQILIEAGRSGRSFRDVAVGRGLMSPQDFVASPPKTVPTGQVLLIFVALMILMGTALLITLRTQEKKPPPPTSHER